MQQIPDRRKIQRSFSELVLIFLSAVLLKTFLPYLISFMQLQIYIKSGNGIDMLKLQRNPFSWQLNRVLFMKCKTVEVNVLTLIFFSMTQKSCDPKSEIDGHQLNVFYSRV